MANRISQNKQARVHLIDPNQAVRTLCNHKAVARNVRQLPSADVNCEVCKRFNAPALNKTLRDQEIELAQAFEVGWRCHERGLNLEAARLEFNKLMAG